MLTLLVIDDHPLYRAGVAGVLRRRFMGAEVHEADGVEAGLRALEAHPDVDLALVDVRLADGDGFRAIQTIGARFPQVARVLISGVEGADAAAHAQRVGASGFLPKSIGVSAMLDAIARVLEGGTCFLAEAGSPPAENGDLSLRQREVLVLIANGFPNKQIAREMGITERTVKFHLAEIFRRLGVGNRTQALAEATRRGLVTLQQPP